MLGAASRQNTSRCPFLYAVTTMVGLCRLYRDFTRRAPVYVGKINMNDRNATDSLTL